MEGSRPGLMDFAARAKYDAWKEVKGLPAEKALADYEAIVQSLLPTNSAPGGNKSAPSPGGVPGLHIAQSDRIYRIEWDRADKFNAITWEMYEGVIAAMAEASAHPATAITVLSGRGHYYCSGNDLSNFTRVRGPDEMKQMAEKGEDVLERFVRSGTF